LEKIKGYVDKIIYRNNENGYTVFNLEENGCETVCVGVFHFISEGEYLELAGSFVFHGVYGEQFKVDGYENIIPQGVVAIERYLASGAIKGVGKVTARRIIQEFGEDALRIIDEEPERLARIKGISMRKAQEISAQQEEKKDLRKALIFLGEYGISNTLAVKIYNQYGSDVYTIIRENPYRLADDITGIGFRKADEIAFHAGVSPNSEFRIKSCIIHLLHQAASDGHVYLPEEELKRRIFKTLHPVTTDDLCDIQESEVEKCIMDLAIDSRLILKESEEGRQVFYTSYYHTELNIAKMLHRLNLKGSISQEEFAVKIADIEKETGTVLDELQRKAVEAAARSGVLILTGGPGTGKTTTINAIIRYFEREYKEIFLAAPTGRAAKRMTETCRMEAKTIHRMLELSGEIEDTSAGARFERNEECPLEADIIIIDEVSMVDIFLMNALLKAIAPGTRLILVGDSNQLPSVGAGNVLRDIIDSGCFNTVQLTRIFRQAEESDIVVNAHKINRGEQIELRPDSRDCIFIKRDNPNIILGGILTLLRDKLPGYVDVHIRDIQVLSPAKKGSLGVERINVFLQENLNPPSPSKKELPVRDMVFREGDKVMHIRNNYSLEWELQTGSGFVYDRGKGIFNGDIGIIEKINEHTQLMEVIFDDGKHVIYNFEQLDELTLSYASTIHKAQGSEYPAVILPLLSGPALLMNRNILYTAVTRARKCVCIVGSDETVRRMINNVREARRFSGLKTRILELKGHVL
jgi:exodeoxyribonuclease V alpha subunit